MVTGLKNKNNNEETQFFQAKMLVLSTIQNPLVAIRGKHAKFVYHIYSSMIQHIKTAVAMEMY